MILGNAQPWLAILVAVALATASCSAQDSSDSEAAIAAAVAATVDAIAATPEPVQPDITKPSPEEQVRLRNADLERGQQLVDSVLDELARRSELTAEIARLEEEIAGLEGGLSSGDEDGNGRPDYLDDYFETLLSSEREAADALSEGLIGRFDRIEELQDELAEISKTLQLLDEDGEDPEFELLEFLREMTGDVNVDISDATPDRLRSEVEAAVDARAASLGHDQAFGDE